jgi:hypothetical protein
MCSIIVLFLLSFYGQQSPDEFFESPMGFSGNLLKNWMALAKNNNRK